MSVITPESIINGIGYVACVRDPATHHSFHNQEDFFQAVAFIDPNENLDYGDMIQIVETNNKLTFFSNRIDKTCSTFTWQQALNSLAKLPPRGGKCQTFHLKPITFGEFIEMAYSNGTLDDSVGYGYKVATTRKISPQNSFMPPVLLPASSSIVNDDIVSNVANEEIVEDGNGSEPFTPPSEVVWRQRALLAEARVATLEGEMLDKDKLIMKTKAKLTSTEDAKVRFSAQADLAANLAAEYRKNSTTPIIAGLKDELKLLPEVHKMLKGIVPKVNTLDEVNATVQELRKIAVELNEKLKAHDELVASMGDDRDMETLLGKVSKVIRILEQFGFTMGSSVVDVPLTLRSLAPPQHHAGHGQINNQVGSFLKDKGNNNTKSNVPLLSHPPPPFPHYPGHFTQGLTQPPTHPHFPPHQSQQGLPQPPTHPHYPPHQQQQGLPQPPTQAPYPPYQTQQGWTNHDGSSGSFDNFTSTKTSGVRLSDDRSSDRYSGEGSSDRNSGERSSVRKGEDRFSGRKSGDRSSDRQNHHQGDQVKRFRKN